MDHDLPHYHGVWYARGGPPQRPNNPTHGPTITNHTDPHPHQTRPDQTRYHDGTLTVRTEPVGLEPQPTNGRTRAESYMRTQYAQHSPVSRQQRQMEMLDI